MLSQLKKCFSRKMMANMVSVMMLFVFMNNVNAEFYPITVPVNIFINNQGGIINNVNNFRHSIYLNTVDVGAVLDIYEPDEIIQWCVNTNAYANVYDFNTIINNIPSRAITHIPNMFYGIGVLSNGGVQYVTNSQSVCSPAFPASDIANHRNFDVLISLSSKGVVPPGVYFQGGYGSLTNIGIISQRTNYFYGSVFYMEGTITVVASTCQLQTSRYQSVNWPSLSPLDIQNNVVDNKPTPITVGCEDNISHPVTVNVTSNTGYADAANGIVNTSTSNLGLQLTWGRNGQKIPLNQPMSFDAKDIKDFSVNARPVATGAGTIAGGDFATNVTVSFEYH